MALRGINVLELAGLAPAPFCGMVLADFGASVTRIDRAGEFVPNLDSLANGKKSVALNLKHTKGIEVFQEMCKSSDVLIEPFRKGVMERLGLGPEVLYKDNKRLVYARLTGFGQTGYYSERAGHDINYAAVSGVLSMFGWRSGAPSPPVNFAADFGGGGLMCALGIVMALFERNASGLGQVVDCSMVEGTAYLGSWLYRSQNLPVWGQPRGKNMLDGGAHFYDTYETLDAKWMAVGALEPQFYSELLDVLGIPEDELPQYGDAETSRSRLAEAFKQRTQDEWCKLFDGRDACVTPVLERSEACVHEHNMGRGSFVRDCEGALCPGPAPRLQRTPATSCASLPVPQRGQHTRDTLAQLGYTHADISYLKLIGAIDCTDKAKL